MSSSPSLLPMPYPMAGPGALPVTRYAVSSDPITNAGATAPSATWLPAGLAALAVASTLAGLFAYRAAHRPTEAAAPPAVVVLEPVPVGLPVTATATVAATASATVAPSAPSATVAPSATLPEPLPAASVAPTTRVGSPPRPPTRPTARPPATGTPVDPGSPRPVTDRDGKR